ncbi:MAG: YlxR family protein [Eubacteriaceae bacterium]|nr:YlxR family protein [Eubacteriaceae bacterium]
MKRQPVRTCVICRDKDNKRQLLRIVRTPEKDLTFDPSGKMNGRGAYVCAKDECLNLAKNKKRIDASLNLAAPVGRLEEIENEMREFLNARN